MSKQLLTLTQTMAGTGAAGGGGGPVLGDTTIDGKQAHLYFGESNMGDTTAAVGVGAPIAAGIAEYWNGSANIALTTNDCNLAGPTYGTGYKQFAEKRFNDTGFKSIIFNYGSGGADVCPTVDLNDFSTTGSKYAPMVTAAKAGLLANSLGKFRSITFLLGTNDQVAAASLVDINTHATSLITRLIADFPDTEIYIILPGMYSGAAEVMDARKWGVYKIYYDLTVAYANVRISGSMYNMYVWGYGFGDKLHLTTPGYGKMMEIHARSVSSTEADKETRRMQCMMHNEPLPLQKAGIKDFFQTKGYRSILEGLQLMVGGVKNQMLYDFIGWTTPLDLGFDIPNADFIHTDATPKYWVTNFVPSVGSRVSSVADFIEGIKTGVNLTPVATGAVAMGVATGTLRRIFQTTASNTFWSANDTTNTTYATWTKIPDNTRLAIGRNGTQKQLYGNSVIVQTATLANTAISALSTRIGGNGNAGNFIDCQFCYWYCCKNVGTNVAQFEADLEAFMLIMKTAA